MNMLQFPFLVLFDGDLCLASADAVRSAILTADAFGVVGEKDESCVFVHETRFNFLRDQINRCVRFLDSADQKILADGFVAGKQRGDRDQGNVVSKRY